MTDRALTFTSGAWSQVFSILALSCPCLVDTLGDISRTLLALAAKLLGARAIPAVGAGEEALGVGRQEGVVLTISAFFSAEARKAGWRAHLAGTTHRLVAFHVVASGAVILACC